MTVAVTRKEPGAVGLRREARRCRDAAASRRMLALVLEGASREEAARAAGMGRQTLRDRGHRYNAEGLAGLRERPPSGREPRLTPRQEAGLAAARGPGADPDRDGVVRWRGIDLKALIETRFGVRLHERSVGEVPRRLGFARLSVRPQHPKADEAAQAAFEKASPSWWCSSGRGRPGPSGPTPPSSRAAWRPWPGWTPGWRPRAGARWRPTPRAGSRPWRPWTPGWPTTSASASAPWPTRGSRCCPGPC